MSDSSRPDKKTYLQATSPAQTIILEVLCHQNRLCLRSSVPVCKESHPLYKCSTFRSWNQDERHVHARKMKLCFNCLSSGHSLQGCPRKRSCCECHRRHHTLLHRPTMSSTSSADVSSTTEASFKIQTPSNIPCIIQTALVTAAYDQNRSRARAFLDPGSSTALVTSRLASSLQAKRTPAVTKLEGFAGEYVSQSIVELTLFSIANPNISGLQIRAHVVD